MRLIDADKFKKRYCDENCGKNKCRDNFDKCQFILELELESTAFDIDGVIEDLKKCFGMVKSCSVDYAEGLKDGCERAIDIVRCTRGE